MFTSWRMCAHKRSSFACKNQLSPENICKTPVNRFYRPKVAEYRPKTTQTRPKKQFTVKESISINLIQFHHYLFLFRRLIFSKINHFKVFQRNICLLAGGCSPIKGLHSSVKINYRLKIYAKRPKTDFIARK